MTLRGLEPRLRQLGRIRLGQKSAKGHPERLATWRLTSSDRQVLIDAASLYGGTPQPWQGAPTEGQWEVVTDTDTLKIVLPPDRALTQAYELWSGGGCQRRCDGLLEQLTDQPCLCQPAVDTGTERACKPTTRLNVLLPNLPGLGVWRLDTHGAYAAVELAGVVELVAHLQAFVPAKLRIEQRIEKRIRDGKAETLRFPVPVIDLDVTPGQIAGLIASPSSPQPAVERPTRPAIEPPQVEPSMDSIAGVRAAQAESTAVRNGQRSGEVAVPPGETTGEGEAPAASPGITGRDLLGELKLSANEALRVLAENGIRGKNIKDVLDMTGDDLAKATPILTGYQQRKAELSTTKPDGGS